MPLSTLRLNDKQAKDLRLAAKVAVAAGGAFVLATLLNLPQGYWSVISALIVVQGSVGGTLVAAQERAVGTLLGAAVGGAAAFLHPHSLIQTSVALTVTVAVLAFVAAGRPSLRLAPVTAAILLVATANQSDSLVFAGERVLEVLLGCAVGIAATALVFPARLDRDLTWEARGIAADIATLLRGGPNRVEDPNAAHALMGTQDMIRRKLSAFERSIADARRVPGFRAMTETRATLARTLWRVRNDAIATEKALTAAPAAARRALGAAVPDLIAAQADLLDAVARGEPVDAAATAGIDARLSAVDQAVERIRRGEVEGLDVAATVPTMSLVFALRSLTRNLDDLAQRLGETKQDPPLA